MGWISDKTLIAVDEVFKRMKVDTDPIFTPRFRKFIHWFGYSAIPFVFSIATIIVMIFIFTTLLNRVGFERTAIILLVLLWLKNQK